MTQSILYTNVNQPFAPFLADDANKVGLKQLLY